MKKISVCLATFNEEKNIKDCLESVKWADEIVIVDGSSTDKTIEIARKYTQKIIIRENPLMFHINKQKAFEVAKGDWILYLDADERVSPKLKQEVLNTINQPSINHQSTINQPLNGYWLPRKNIIFGKWIKNSFWYPDYQLRLFKRGQAYLPCKSVHEQPKIKGKTEKLKNPLLHCNYQTVNQYVRKINDLYSENDAEVFISEGKKVHWPDAIRFPVREFLSTFFARKGYEDGLHGLVLSFLQAFSALITFAKIWEKQGFEKVIEVRFLEKVEEEFNQANGELSYWLATSQLGQAKSWPKKVVLKVKRRFGL